jgi:hypothetical protein
MLCYYYNKNKQIPWPQYARELCRPSNRRLSAKLVPNSADREVSRSQSGGSPTALISVFYTGAPEHKATTNNKEHITYNEYNTK